jgi:membrane protein
MRTLMRNWPGRELSRRLRETVTNWQADDGPTLAAAVAYYAALSLFPLLLLLIASLGIALRYSTGAQNARQQLLDLAAKNASPVLAEHLGKVLGQISAKAVWGGPLGLVALLLAAIGVFTQIELAFDRIWKTPSPAWRGVLAAVLNALYHRLRAFLMMLGAGLLLWAILAATIAASTFRALTVQLPLGAWVWDATEIAIGIVLFSLLFTLVYKSLPKAPVRWSAAARGGLLAGVLWEATRQVLSYLLVGEQYTAYGVVGSLIAVMLWIYIAGSILFLGAEYARVADQRKGAAGSAA